MKAVISKDPRQAFYKVPFSKLLGMRRAYSEEGKSLHLIKSREDLGNLVGSVHGGVLMTLLDVGMASAAASAVEFKRTAVTLNMTCSFLGPAAGEISCYGELLSRDENIAWCSAYVTDHEGNVIATGQGSFRYVSLPI